MNQQKTNEAVKKPAMPGRFVTARSLEAKSLIKLLQEYDGCIVYIRNRWGRDGFDTNKANEIINRCNKIEEQFKEIVDEMKAFIKKNEEKRKNASKQDNLPEREEVVVAE